MAAVLERTGVGVQEFGTSVKIPENPKAKLMYYFECICTVLDLSNQENIGRLRYMFMTKIIIMVSNNMVCAYSKGSDKPAHTSSLIRAFASRLNIL